MPNFKTLEPAIDPNNRISFLLDWELTMKCNLSCSYCDEGIYGGRDNSQPHPPVNECLKTLDFMFAYANEYMQHKPKGIKSVILNVYGGESLFHPSIVDILTEARSRHEKYKDQWALTITTTTNLIVSNKTLDKIIPLIDEFTVSQHSEVNEKQKQQFKDNILKIKSADRRVKAVVLMHHNPELFTVSEEFITWAERHEIKVLPRQLDSYKNDRVYGEKQVEWFNSEYSKKTYGKSETIKGTQNLTNAGRACCGGRQICLDQNYSERKYYVLGNSFENWYCSVNWFFLHIKQVNGEVYFNKDCKMNFDGKVAPMGTLADTDKILSTLKNQLETEMPIVQCKKKMCLCGLCAPKAENLNDYKKIMLKYQRKLL